ncbi:MAG: hypothetical protein U5L09_04195 [Bacteroidales bacterium]|nr:hypothetical protein [Bacteroidales bacterium]
MMKIARSKVLCQQQQALFTGRLIAVLLSKKIDEGLFFRTLYPVDMRSKGMTLSLIEYPAVSRWITALVFRRLSRKCIISALEVSDW